MEINDCFARADEILERLAMRCLRAVDLSAGDWGGAEPPGTCDDFRVPEGFVREFFDELRMQRARDWLDGVDHFHAASLAGRTYYLECRYEDAAACYELAAEAAMDAPESTRNVCRLVILASFVADLRRHGGQHESIPLPSRDRFHSLTLSGALPYLDRARAAEAESDQDWIRADRIYRRICQANPSRWPIVGGALARRAAIAVQTRDPDSFLRCAESAEIAYSSVERPLHRGTIAATLAAACEVAGDWGSAKHWAGEISRAGCSREGLVLLERRRESIVEEYQRRGVLTV